jgi:hypothetical protein
MLLTHQTHALNAACEDYNIPLPDYVLAAQDLKAAVAALYAKVGAETPPTTNGVTTKTLEATFKALLAWPGHDARLAVADRLTQVGETAVIDAWTRFSQVLMEELRVPFDKAAIAYVAGGTLPYTAVDQVALTTLMDLARVRDIFAGMSKPPDLRTTLLEQATRVLDVVSARHALYVLTNKTRGLDRYGADWFAAVRLVDGVTIRWMTPADQVAMDKVLPQEMRTREGAKV